MLSKMNRVKLIFLLFLFSSNFCVAQKLELPKIFSDGMVLQQGIACPVWGRALKNETVTLQIDGKTLTTTSNSQGKWIVKLPVFKAGGPYTLTIQTKEKVVINDVMFGEVWLASGQSNMNFAINRPILNANEVIAEANYPLIRMITVEPSVNSYPISEVKSKGWEVCSPQTVEKFSAVAYFFARKLHQDKKVAVGIIHSSYSGSPAEAWLTKDILSVDSVFSKQLNLIQNERENWAVLQEKEKTVTNKYNEIVKTSTIGLDSNFHQSNYNDKHWKRVDFPISATRLKIAGYKLIWLRKTFILNEEPNTDYEIRLGEVKMRDRTYVNGIFVGETNKEQERTYKIPQSALKKGENVIAIRWLSEWGYGSVGNNTKNPIVKNLKTGVDISIAGEWKYNDLVEPELKIGVSYHRNPTAIYNAMIAPLAEYGIKGALWYQGESNAGKANEYPRLMQLLIKDWRNIWKQGDFPFLIVQLPNYIDGGLNWVKLREAQTKIAKETPNTFLATTIDVGDPLDLHPKNKLPVGERLYAVASKNVYQDKTVGSGPILKKTYLKNGSLWLEFSNSKGLFATGDSTQNAFMVAGEDQKFVKASFTFIKNKVKLTSEVLKPIAVRYNWEANPSQFLYNNSGLAATPFRTDNWEY
jgi:sialate O-acetylesterase